MAGMDIKIDRTGLPVELNVLVEKLLPAELHFRDLELGGIQDPKVRLACQTLVTDLQGSQVLTIGDKDDAKTRERIRETLQNLKVLGPDASEAIPVLQTIAASQTVEIAVRSNSIDTLRKIDESTAVESLKLCLTQSRSPHTWEGLEAVFYKLSDSARPELLEQIQSAAMNLDEPANQQTGVRAAAKRMLASIPGAGESYQLSFLEYCRVVPARGSTTSLEIPRRKLGMTDFAKACHPEDPARDLYQSGAVTKASKFA